MAQMSAKNSMLAMGAAHDLGLGDQLQSQTEAEINERKKKLMKQSQMGMSSMGPATQSLFGASGGFNA